MGKRTEDEIARKLADLEVAMKHEQAMKEAEDAVIVDDGETDELQQQLSRVEQQIKSKEKLGKKKGAVAAKSSGELSILGWTESELYKWGGVASLGAGLLLFMSHIVLTTLWTPWGGTGFMVLPALVGIGMLIYNYKSKIAQAVTVGGFLLVMFAVMSRLTLAFIPLTLFDLILLALPTICGVVLLAKSFAKQREARESIKLIE